MKIFGIKSELEIQGDKYIVEKLDAKGINVRHIRGGRKTWISRVNVEKLYDRGELKQI